MYMVGWTDGYTTRHYQPLKLPPNTQASTKNTHMHAIKQAYVRTTYAWRSRGASKQACACSQEESQASKQAGRQAWVCSLLCCCSDKKDILFFSPAKKKLTTNPLPITETLKQKKHNHCTHAQHTTRHETTTKEASSTTLYSTQNRDDDDGRRWWWWVYAMCNFKYGGGVNKVREKQFSSLW